MNDGISFSELLDYSTQENHRWKQFFARSPETLDLPLDIAGTVGQLVLHIFAVELYFANVISGQENADPDQLPTESLDDIFAVGEKAREKYLQFFASAKDEDWAATVQLGRINLQASKRKLVAQALTHSMRHWAQIATFLRQHGFKQEWGHDLLMSKALE
jgi:uncharacterized damage-inducible protein DinB